ncbi:unnamed protein product [Paramecium primaurelia]|uniref:Uncharacterized protein n=1 Tax=Paramecium primaurelia TaxID=5886 RepID=A0A8S1N4U1_PARPR|nr:unnamed protein product [Paramecium primaurelia]
MQKHIILALISIFDDKCNFNITFQYIHLLILILKISTPLLKLKQSFFQSISKYSYFFLFAQKKQNQLKRNFKLKKIQINISSFDHLQIIRETISQQQLIQKYINFHSEYQQQERKQLFNSSIARELNQTGIAVYLGLFQAQIYIFKIVYPLLKITFLKRKRLKKNILSIQKGFINYFLNNRKKQISDLSIVQFFKCEKYKHDSVSALNLLIKATGYQISSDIKRKFLIQKRKQLNLNIIIAKKSILYCQQFMRILLEQKYIRVALLVLILFELDLTLNYLPQLSFVDVLQNKTQKSIKVDKVVFQKSTKLQNQLLNQFRFFVGIIKFKYHSFNQKDKGYLNEEAKQFIKGFNFSAIKSIKKQLNPYSKAQNQLQTNDKHQMKTKTKIDQNKLEIKRKKNIQQIQNMVESIIDVEALNEEQHIQQDSQVLAQLFQSNINQDSLDHIKLHEKDNQRIRHVDGKKKQMLVDSSVCLKRNNQKQKIKKDLQKKKPQKGK